MLPQTDKDFYPATKCLVSQGRSSTWYPAASQKTSCKQITKYLLRVYAVQIDRAVGVGGVGGGGGFPKFGILTQPEYMVTETAAQSK